MLLFPDRYMELNNAITQFSIASRGSFADKDDQHVVETIRQSHPECTFADLIGVFNLPWPNPSFEDRFGIDLSQGGAGRWFVERKLPDEGIRVRFMHNRWRPDEVMPFQDSGASLPGHVL